jgi:hypothetical protein
LGTPPVEGGGLRREALNYLVVTSFLKIKTKIILSAPHPLELLILVGLTASKSPKNLSKKFLLKFSS